MLNKCSCVFCLVLDVYPQSEQREKEKRQKDKQEAHLYCHVRIATDSDIAQQVGSSQWFDLVDYDKLPADRTFRVRKLTPFADFKKQVGVMLVTEPLLIPMP